MAPKATALHLCTRRLFSGVEIFCFVASGLLKEDRVLSQWQDYAEPLAWVEHRPHDFDTLTLANSMAVDDAVYGSTGSRHNNTVI